MRLIIAGLALAAIPAAAFAQDATPSDGPGFEGVYVGGSVGISVQDNDRGERVLFDRGFNGSLDTITTAAGANAFSPGFCNGAATSSANVACTNDRDDVEYAARVGWDTQDGPVVIGIVGEFGKSQVRDSVSAFSTTPANYVFNRELQYYGTIRARAGYTPNNSTLFYSAFGPAYAKIRNSFTSSNTANQFSDNGKTESWGYTAGGGVEQKLGNNFSIGLEYMYNNYQDDDYRVRVTQGTAPASNPFILNGSPGTEMRRSAQNFDFHSIRATAAFRF